MKDGAVVHRRTFAIFDFVFTWLNLASGLTVAIARAGVNAFVAIVLYGRVDTSLLPKTFEFMDTAYASYVGMVCIDHNHNHPVAVVFSSFLVDLLKTRRRAQKAALRGLEIPLDDLRARWTSNHGAISKARLQQRFWLYVILSQNPSLITYRRRDQRPPDDISVDNIDGDLNGSGVSKAVESAAEASPEVQDPSPAQIC
mmetsp:Transcript_39992/g.93810  ORF Transcript_39992/g.93810 Transcript_39992/m.93810 type:complete len:199 (+) Transcript_39992:532-1128(+)